MRMSPRRSELFDQIDHIGGMTPAQQTALGKEWLALEAVTPMWSTSFDQYMASLQHLIDVAGIDHVCMGADFDGGGGFPGLDNVSLLPRITARLKAGGMSDTDLDKLWSGNLLRVLDAAAKAAH
jgi:membrane dipeptidase